MKILPSMKCPYIIEPHQIQGLDFINIFPLVQWLIKYSSEFREAKEDELRKFAVMQYEKDHIFESDRVLYLQNEKLLKNLVAVQVLLLFFLTLLIYCCQKFYSLEAMILLDCSSVQQYFHRVSGDSCTWAFTRTMCIHLLS